jgi:hypothetical protein
VAIFVKEQYIVDEKGKPQAIVLGIEKYRRMMALLQEKKDYKESMVLARSKVFKKMVQRGLKEINEGKVKHWKEVWDEL